MTASTTFEQLFHDAVLTGDESTLISARAAFQTVLAGEAGLVDLRPAASRLTEGGVARELEPLYLSPSELSGVAGPTVLLCTDGSTAARVAEALRRLGASSVRAVDGGFLAWRSAGMPVC